MVTMELRVKKAIVTIMEQKEKKVEVVIQAYLAKMVAMEQREKKYKRCNR